MPDDLLLADGCHMRVADAAYVFECIQDAVCCSVVAVSNMGKSALLRLIADPAVQASYLGDLASSYTFVLVDCNRMLELSEQGFYELVVRCLMDRLVGDNTYDDICGELQATYDLLIHPASSFDIPLSFNRAMTLVNESTERNLVLLFDEVDQAVAGIQSRVFLNLRALKDQYKGRLVYVTATDQTLREIRQGTDIDEFNELFTHHTYHLPPLSEQDTEHFARRFAKQEGVSFDEADQRFIYHWAGGHPGLLEATCQALGRVTGAHERDEIQDWVIHREVASWLSDELSVRVECRKIWEDLSQQEQQSLMGVDRRDRELSEEIVAVLRKKHILVQSGEETDAFSRLFGEFINRLRATRSPASLGVRVDVESGEVMVDGKVTDTLTNLEYRLLLLLYGRLGQIVGKYDVVEAVWGEDYIDDVDDARIEKLVSRLRNKIEPEPRNPRYLVTVRGRGYRLET
ncbi:MAG: winged helix-turn-helix domain-containing protein [Chloroflexota bacterium]|nr:winged helix-turn-helix domain-containing protein [Chloroflexota bacterium]